MILNFLLLTSSKQALLASIDLERYQAKLKGLTPTAIITSNAVGSAGVLDIILPIVYNISVIALGALCGWILSQLLTPNRSQDNRLILVVAMLLALSGICGL